MRRLLHTVRAGRAGLSAGARAAAAAHRLLEFPGQRGRHPAVLVSGQQLGGRIPSRRSAVQDALREGVTADRLPSVGDGGQCAAARAIQCGRDVRPAPDLDVQLYVRLDGVLVFARGGRLFASDSLREYIGLGIGEAYGEIQI